MNMITKDIAVASDWRDEFYHKTLRNADGTAVRCRVNGKCKTWKTRPDDFRLPVKYGLSDCFYITPRNAAEWLLEDPTEAERVAKREAKLNRAAGLADDTPAAIRNDYIE